jgi:hypothetical protein
MADHASDAGAARLWHATPLHYLPRLLATGALLSQERLRQDGHPVRPRPTAAARVRKLGLAGYVHLSLTPKTPLLADKRAKGYPHSLLAFDREAVFALPGAALMKFNTKSWRHRDDFAPVTDPAERAVVLAEHAAGRYPSLEALAAGELPLALYLRALYFASEPEAGWFTAFIDAGLVRVPDDVAAEVHAGHFPPGAEPVLAPLAAYADACVAAGAVLPPPDLPFD